MTNDRSTTLTCEARLRESGGRTSYWPGNMMWAVDVPAFMIQAPPFFG